MSSPDATSVEENGSEEEEEEESPPAVGVDGTDNTRTPSKRKKATAAPLQTESMKKRRVKETKEGKAKPPKPRQSTCYQSIPKFTRPKLDSTHEQLIEQYKQFASEEAKRMDIRLSRNKRRREKKREKKHKQQNQRQEHQELSGEKRSFKDFPEEDGEKEDTQDNNQGWTVRDFLELDTLSDFLQEDYGVDYLEEGRKLNADDTYCSKLSIRSISNLIGFANGDNYDNSCVREMHSSSNNKINDTNVSDRSVFKESGINCSELKKFIETRMWHVPNIPMKQTHLEFILLCAGLKLCQSEAQAGERNDCDDEEVISNENENNGEYKVVMYKVDGSDNDDNCSSDDSDDDSNMSSLSFDSVYEHFRDFKLPKQVQGWKWKAVTKDSVQSHSYSSQKKKNEVNKNCVKEKERELKNLHSSFDETALVCLGMLIEECMNVSLLPLARDHVLRCRMLESLKKDNEDGSTINIGLKESNCTSSDNPFAQWTLPPDEAIVQLCQCFKQRQRKSTFPPLSSFSSKDISSNYWRRATHSHNSNDPIQGWCKSHGFDSDFVIHNMDLFEQFIRGPAQRAAQKNMEYHVKNENEVVRALAKSFLTDNDIDSWPIPEIEILHSMMNSKESESSVD